MGMFRIFTLNLTLFITKHKYTMKALFITAANLIFITSFSFGQILSAEQMGGHVPISVPAKVLKQHNERGPTMTVDYQYLDLQFHGATTPFGWTMGDSGVVRYACVLLDTVVDISDLQGYDFANMLNYRIDSVHISVGHTNSSGQNNKFLFRLVDLGTNNYPNYSDVDLWRDTIITNTSLFGQTSWLQFGTIDLGVGITMNNTDRVGMFFEFEGQPGDTAGLLASWLPDGPCTSSDRTRFSYFSWPHSYYFYQENINSWLPTITGSDVYWDCNNNQQYDQGIDSESYLQDIDIWFDITLDVTIGMSEFDNSKNFQIHPNPTTGVFTVTGTEPVQVFDLLGNLLLRTTSREINLSSYPAGIYMVKIGETTQKMVLSR